MPRCCVIIAKKGMDMRRDTVLYIIIILISASITAGCGKKENVLVKIDKIVITAEDFEKRISVLPTRYQEVIKPNKRKFLDELIVDELLYREALRQNLHKEKDVRAVIEQARKKILISKLLKEKIDDVASVTDEDVEDYYKTYQDEFKTPEILRASHILVKTEKEIKDILLELANNRNFEDLARARSIDPTAQKGGDIGYFTRGQLDPDFEEVCFRLKEGEISDIVKTRFGYHIIKLTEKKPPAIEKYEDAKGRIGQTLVARKRKKYFNDLVQHLKDRAKIEINEKSPVFGENEKND